MCTLYLQAMFVTVPRDVVMLRCCGMSRKGKGHESNIFVQSTARFIYSYLQYCTNRPGWSLTSKTVKSIRPGLPPRESCLTELLSLKLCAAAPCSAERGQYQARPCLHYLLPAPSFESPPSLQIESPFGAKMPP